MRRANIQVIRKDFYALPSFFDGQPRPFGENFSLKGCHVPDRDVARKRMPCPYLAEHARKSHPHANKPEIPLSLLKDEPFIGLNRMYPNYGEWLLKVCRHVGFKPRIVKEADGAASALAFVAAGFGVAVVSEPLQKIPARDVIFRDLSPKDRTWVPVGAAWKPDAVSAPVVSRFVDILAQICAAGNGESRIQAINLVN